MAPIRLKAELLALGIFWRVGQGVAVDSWLNNRPVRGRANYPLLFDRQGRPKPALQNVLAAGR